MFFFAPLSVRNINFFEKIFLDKLSLLVKIDRNCFLTPKMIIYAPFESPNRVDSKYVVLENVCIDFLAKKTFEKPIHIPTIKRSGFRALNS
jgi:hypothetical protein